jgi:hyperosmotically inducible protein
MKFAFAILACTVALVGCNSEDAADLKRDAGALAQTTGKVLTNGQLVARINMTLAQTKGVDMKGLHIEAKNGAVMVGGHVRNSDEKARVIEVVKSIRGVESVRDELRIEK